MDDKDKDKKQYDEPNIEDFFFDEEEEEIEKTKRRKKRRKVLIIVISFLLLFQGSAVFFHMFSLDAIDFLMTSYRLSKNETVQQWKETVVTIKVEKGSGSSKGTGFLISSDGLIVTNYHVIEDNVWIGVNLTDNTVHEGKVVSSFPEHDLAFLSITGDEFPFLPLSKADGLQGEKIIVIGNPLFFTHIANEGLIVEDGVNNNGPLSISAPIYKGNSGSPVINERGEVVGVVYAKTIPKSGEKSVGLALPVMYIKEHLPEKGSTIK